MRLLVSLAPVWALENVAVVPTDSGIFRTNPHRRLGGLAKAGGDNAACDKCVTDAAKWIMDHEFEAIDKWCGTPENCEGKQGVDAMKCNKKDEFCQHWRDDRLVMEGLLIEKTHPLSLGYAYCVGTQVCTPGKALGEAMFGTEDKCPADAAFLTTELTEETSQTLEADNLMMNHGQDEAGDKQFMMHRERPHGGFVAGLVESVENLFGFGHHHHHGAHWGPDADDEDRADEEALNKITVPKIAGIDRRCYQRTTKWIMDHVIKQVVILCQKPPCKFMKCWCEWAGKHKEMAYGMILAKVEPWKYALGRCFHPKGHGKGHHKGKGKGKGKHHHGKGKGKHHGKGGGKEESEDEHFYVQHSREDKSDMVVEIESWQSKDGKLKGFSKVVSLKGKPEEMGPNGEMQAAEPKAEEPKTEEMPKAEAKIAEAAPLHKENYV